VSDVLLFTAPAFFFHPPFLAGVIWPLIGIEPH